DPFSTKDRAVPPEIAEIRLAILAEIRRKSHISGGRKVFPYNQLRIYLRGVDESRRSLFTGRFFRRYFEEEVRTNLLRDNCLFPEDLHVEVEVTSRFPTAQETWLTVEAESAERVPAGQTPAVLVVLEGKANAAELVVCKARINLGRTIEVYRSAGLYRRNDLTFSEDTEINRTVSREHAHILFDAAHGEYRLFNDRWYARDGSADATCGTWVVRGGMSREVHRGGRGMKLESGDEIHLGKAVLRFELP
ncbi:MAG TPA: FHA domain-containing protein, partial [Bryobacteraceae bacterium]|nr:FHA domain-containing protein [Bryobacteraceae bacterium]